MDLILVTALMRALERLLAIGAGLLSIYLGFRLFLALPEVERGAGRIKLPGGISIYLTRVGPGVFFSLFGSAIIALSFYFGVAASETSEGVPAANQVAGGGTVSTQRSFTGAAADAAGSDSQSRQVERATVERMIRDLNRVPALMRDDLAPRDRDLVQTLDQTKMRLMREVWDAETWGDYGAFERWWRAGAGAEPPPQSAAAVAVFRAGGGEP
jgi:hypothetical protein